MSEWKYSEGWDEKQMLCLNLAMMSKIRSPNAKDKKGYSE